MRSMFLRDFSSAPFMRAWQASSTVRRAASAWSLVATVPMSFTQVSPEPSISGGMSAL